MLFKKFVTGLFLATLFLSDVATQTCSSNGCVTFSVVAGTGCAWMCNSCANQLGTNNYYFTTPVCTYQSGGCVGNPIAGASYTCCAV